MVYVKVDEVGGFENALREYMKRLRESGLNDRLNELRYATKPSERKREEKKRKKLLVKIANRNQ